RLDLAQYRELAGFAQFGSDLDKATRVQLDRGERLVEVLKQAQYDPLPINKQIVMLYAGTRGHLDRYPVAEMASYERELYSFLDTHYAELMATLGRGHAIDGRLSSILDSALGEFDAVRTSGRVAAAA